MTEVQRVLFITHKTSGAPARYRVQALGAGLRALGVEVSLAHPDSPTLLDNLLSASHVILFRAWATPNLLESLAEAQTKNPDLIVGFDVDDPLWVKFDTQTEEELRNTEAMQTLMHGCDFMLGSTRELATRGGHFANMPSFHTPNPIHPACLKASQKAHKVPRLPGGTRIAFQSGSGTHNKHWSIAEKAVLNYLRSDAKSTLFMYGITPWNENLEEFRHRIIQVPLMDWNDLPQWINQMDLVVAPVAGERWGPDTKSAIKWLEAALVHTPTLASATEPFRSAISDGVDGFVSEDSQWETNLDRALNKNIRKNVGSSAYEKALSRFSAINSAQTLLNGIQNIAPHRRFIGLEGPLGEQKTIDEDLTLEPLREKERLPRSLQVKLFLNSYR